MRRVIIAITAVALFAGYGWHTASQQSAPFTPEVDEFVDIYLKQGGDKLTDWVQRDKTSRPQQALRAFKPIDGLTMELVASEPAIRQPIDLHFDDRGRLWVVQYLQYPFPAGVNVTSYDQYLRARFDRVPPAPPNHVRGADTITVLEDKDGDGRFESRKDVITGLNITTSVLTGRGGVWVMNPPYLLFYPDRTGDGLPDGDPEVRLEGFGLEDTHSLANSLTWGPDGWLYGVHGSTSTARVRGIAFLGQAVWRYHPERDVFELFAEGGGNPWTLSFDSLGRAFSGDNGGNSRGFHWVRGGRYEKNWPKHGPFTRPHSYGFIPNMDHQGYAARFAMTSVVYEDGRLPGYQGQLVSGMALTSRIQASRLVPDGSTFRTVDTDALVATADRSFRPVDMAVGPDGAIYVADWCDIRMDHSDPRDTWDKSCGRIWRLRARDYSPASAVNLAGQSSQDLMRLLGDKRKWYREQARRLLGERRDRSLVGPLRRLAAERRGPEALEALWTANLISPIDAGWASELLVHPDAPVRAWTLRLLQGSPSVARSTTPSLVRVAHDEYDAEVRSELAATAAVLETKDAMAVLNDLIRKPENIADKHIPLRIWWALESKIGTDADVVLDGLDQTAVRYEPMFIAHLAGRIARRFTTDRGDTPSFTRIDADSNWKEYARYPRVRMPGGKGDYTEWQTNVTPAVSDRNLTLLARLMETATARERDAMLAGIRAGLEQSPAVQRVPERLARVVDQWWSQHARTGDLVAVAAGLGHQEALMARADAGNPSRADSPADERGRSDFLTYCAPCHQTDGAGMAGLAAPLRSSPWVLGREDLLARIVLNGMKGDLLMPAMGTLDDRQLAAILTYIRQAWGHRAAPVSPETVARTRSASAGRVVPWTVQELSALK
jgi:putative membrane-bound dehydrogenase-like protein